LILLSKYKKISNKRSSLPFANCFFVFFILFVSLFYSCERNILENNNEDKIARVGKKFLLKRDLPANLTSQEKNNNTIEDSAKLAKKYIDEWVRETLLLQHAERNLSENQMRFDKMVEDYRKSLITYQYESELVKQKLDTFLRDDEIKQYYEENKANFELKDNIIKVIYIKIRKNAPKIEKVKEWYKSAETKDKDALINYCYQYADNSYLDESTWLLFDDVLKEIPIKLYDKEAFLQNNRMIETQDSAFFYFVNIKGFMIKNAVSPLSFERENIRSMLINKRKVVLIKKMQEDIYNEGIKNKTFEIYE
jgi:hypothetical protein